MERGSRDAGSHRHVLSQCYGAAPELQEQACQAAESDLQRNTASAATSTPQRRGSFTHAVFINEQYLYERSQVLDHWCFGLLGLWNAMTVGLDLEQS